MNATDLDDLLTATLTERADTISANALPDGLVADVAARGRRIRRLRRAMMGVVAATVIAGIAAGMVQLSGADRSSTLPAVPTATVPLPTDPAAAIRALPEGVPLDIVPRAEHLGASWVIITANGRTTVPDMGIVERLAVTPMGTVALVRDLPAQADSTARVLLIGSDGRVDTLTTGLVEFPVVDPERPERYAILRRRTVTGVERTVEVHTVGSSVVTASLQTAGVGLVGWGSAGIVIDDDGSLTVWDPGTGSTRRLEGVPRPVTSAAMTAKDPERLVVVAGRGPEATLGEVRGPAFDSWTPLSSLDRASSLAVSPQGTWAVAGRQVHGPGGVRHLPAGLEFQGGATWVDDTHLVFRASVEQAQPQSFWVRCDLSAVTCARASGPGGLTSSSELGQVILPG